MQRFLEEPPSVPIPECAGPKPISPPFQRRIHLSWNRLHASTTTRQPAGPTSTKARRRRGPAFAARESSAKISRRNRIAPSSKPINRSITARERRGSLPRTAHSRPGHPAHRAHRRKLVRPERTSVRGTTPLAGRTGLLQSDARRAGWCFQDGWRKPGGHVSSPPCRARPEAPGLPGQAPDWCPSAPACWPASAPCCW